jgi:hypothetical protein
MYFIALYINERVDHVLLFKPKQTPSHTETFIIERKDPVDTQLLAFYHHAEKSNNEAKQNNDIIVQTPDKQMRAGFVSIKSEKISDKEFCIDIALRVIDKKHPAPKEINVKELCNDFSFKYGRDNLWPLTLKKELWNDTKRVRVRITIEDSSIHPQAAEIVLVVAAKDQISDTVLDFGSEASQMAISSRNENPTANDIQDIFHSMKQIREENVSVTESIPENTLWNENPASDNKVYEQFESDKLFRTIFYASNEVPDQSPAPYKGGIMSEILYMLTTKNEGQELIGSSKAFVLPAIKIAQFGNIYQPKVECKNARRRRTVREYGKNYFYRACINQFIYVALKECERPCVNLQVLMPNVYSVKTTAENLRYIKEDIEMMLNDKSMVLDHIQAVEVSAISESDASLLGAYDNFQNAIDFKSLSSGNYLIIDSGKGTTDFSVVYLSKKDRKIRNLFRSGVVGAGGVITYGYMLALLYDCLRRSLNQSEVSESNLRSYVFKVLSGDLSYQKQLMAAVEDYKIAVSSGRYKSKVALESEAKVDSIEKIKIEVMIQMVQEMCDKSSLRLTTLTPYAQRYVDDCINNLTDEILRRLYRVNRLGIAPCKKVMLAGRAFMHPQFKKVLLKKLGEKKILPPKGKVELTYNGSAVDHKNVCLFCSLHLVGDSALYNSHMLSVPQMAFDVNREIEKNWRERYLVDMAFKWRDSESYIKKTSAKVLSFFEETLKWLEKSWVNRYSAEEYEPGNTKRNGIVNGFKIKIQSNTDQISFGNTIYNIPNRFSSGDYHLFFTGEALILRSKEGQVEELNSHFLDDQRTELAFATLFPNISVTNPADVWLPTCESASTESVEETNESEVGKKPKSDSKPLSELRDIMDS